MHFFKSLSVVMLGIMSFSALRSMEVTYSALLSAQNINKHLEPVSTSEDCCNYFLEDNIQLEIVKFNRPENENIEQEIREYLYDKIQIELAVKNKTLILNVVPTEVKQFLESFKSQCYNFNILLNTYTKDLAIKDAQDKEVIIPQDNIMLLLDVQKIRIQE